MGGVRPEALLHRGVHVKAADVVGQGLLRMQEGSDVAMWHRATARESTRFSVVLLSIEWIGGGADMGRRTNRSPARGALKRELT